MGVVLCCRTQELIVAAVTSVDWDCIEDRPMRGSNEKISRRGGEAEKAISTRLLRI